MIREKPAAAWNGWPPAVLFSLVVLATMWGFVYAISSRDVWTIVADVFIFLLACAGLAGLFIVNPNEAKVVQVLGTYVGSVSKPGLKWMNPLAIKRKVSQRIRNFESAKLKVNDLDGNPIEIACIVVWKVVDTAEALFNVDDYQNFLRVQSEAALRNLTTSYPYDTNVDGELALRRNSAEITDRLRHELQERLATAGIEVIDTRISHLAYAAEIASAMLRRQQAGAVVAARTRIVEGAVGMVELALAELSKKGVIDLDEERKAAMVSNLMVVLCSDTHTQPVVNTGTLYP